MSHPFFDKGRKDVVYPQEEGYVREPDTFDYNREMQLIDLRYQAENHLLDAVASGDASAAFDAFHAYGDVMQSPFQHPYPSSEDPLRDFKNSVLTMNTLFRKSIERSTVHPIYIHETSSLFSYRVESAQSIGELTGLISEMVNEYCRLVRDCSLARYSGLIREALLYIQLHLCSPLSTAEIASALHVTSNHLSHQFHAEVGMTVTDHIRKQRMQRAAGLLRSTEQSVLQIAGQVGIDNAAYFSRQFRSVYGLSPQQYRSQESGVQS